MSDTKIVWPIGILVIVLLAYGFLRSHNASNTIKIGVIAPLTGTAAIYGEEGRNAILLAIDEINQAGGIQGKQLQAIVEDGKCDAKVALDAWQKLVSVDNAKIVLGGHCSTETLAIAPQAAGSKVLVLSDMTSATTIPSEGDWVFRNSPPNSYYAAKAAKYVYNKGFKVLASITELKDYPKGFTDDFRTAFVNTGGKIVNEQSFSSDVNDFRSLLTKLRASSFDALVVSTQGPETMGLIVKQMKEIGIQAPVVFNVAFNAKKVLTASDGYLPKSFIALTPYTDPGMPAAAKFIQGYEKKFGTGINFNLFYISATYDMVYRLKAAMESCAPNFEDTRCLGDYFAKQKTFNGASGELTFGDDHKPLSRLATVKVVDGKEVYEPIQ